VLATLTSASPGWPNTVMYAGQVLDAQKKPLRT
jgi:hypothetical protein